MVCMEEQKSNESLWLSKAIVPLDSIFRLDFLRNPTIASTMSLDLRYSFYRHDLKFKKPVGTSRGILTEKPSWIIVAEDEDGNKGLGECSFIPGLSPDYSESVEQIIRMTCEKLSKPNGLFNFDPLEKLPAIRFGFETATLDVRNGGKGIL